jgi:glucosylceramidase
MKLQKSYRVVSWLLLVVAVPLFAQTAYFRNSTNATRWVDGGAIAGTPWATTANYFTVDSNTRYQTIMGFGGCFTELAWNAINDLPSTAARDSVIRALFDTSGCNYNFCRIAIGANDFANGWYSYNETANDYTMTNFSIARELTNNIAFIKAAQVYSPNMRFWGSPWSPPTWMKSNGAYNNGTMKTDAQTMTAYALYLSKTVQAFQGQGINIELITCQNEPDMCNHNYPTCCWNNGTTPAANEVNFYANYMIPRFNTDGLTTKIIVGVYCCGTYDTWIAPHWANATVAAKIGAVSHSWQDYSWGATNWTQHPSTPFFETEADWGSGGAHDWAQGVTQWNSRINFLTTGRASVFQAWGMVLDERYTTYWGFPQSGPININRTTHVITYEPHYYADKHISHYVKPGAKAINITTTGTNPGSKAAFLNPNGDIIVVSSNTSATALAATVRVGNTMYRATLPANSFNTLMIRNSTSAVQGGLQLQSSAMPALSNVSIRNSTLYFSLSAGVNAREADLTLTDLQGRTVWTGHRTGSALQGNQQAFAVRSERGNLRSGTYLLAARIKNEAGAVTTIEKKVAAVN